MAFAFAALTAVAAPTLGPQDAVDAALLYLVVTLAVAAAWGYVAGVLSAVTAGLLVNYFFLSPTHAFSVEAPSNVVLLVLYLVVALIGAGMLSLVRRQYLAAEAGRTENEILLRISQEMASTASPAAAARLCTAIARAAEAAGCSIVVERDGWKVAATTGTLELSREDEAIAAEACRSGGIIWTGTPSRRLRRPVRRGTAEVVFVPFHSPGRGALRLVRPAVFADRGAASRLLLAMADEANVAWQRACLAETAGRVDGLVQSDELKSALLASISHDLRSPLTSIKASVSSLRDSSVAWTPEDADSFLEEIECQTDRLTRTVTNLLTLDRLKAGVVRPHLEPVEVAGLIDEVLAACAEATRGRPVSVKVQGALWLRTDYAMAVQALMNLVNNAARHSVAGGAISIHADSLGHGVAIQVCDEGPGLA
jgi:two-component system sensor histidine kinase KdpD